MNTGIMQKKHKRDRKKMAGREEVCIKNLNDVFIRAITEWIGVGYCIEVMSWDAAQL